MKKNFKKSRKKTIITKNKLMNLLKNLTLKKKLAEKKVSDHENFSNFYYLYIF